MLRNNIKKILSIAVSVFIFIGCASIVSKSQYPISFRSNPTHAKIIIRDEAGITVHEGETPATVTLNTKRGYFKGKDYTVWIFPIKVDTVKSKLLIL